MSDIKLSVRENEVIKNRYDFVMLFDCEYGNPNGDPDAGNMPRTDPETGIGFVTDVFLKRKVRNYVETVMEDQSGFEIYVKDHAILNNQHRRAYEALDIKVVEKAKPKEEEKAAAVTKWMCDNFFDIRTFGAVMTNGVNCGQVQGPIQINMAHSIDPVSPRSITITRMAVTNEKDANDQNHTMGEKNIIPYGLYRVEGYVSANLANKSTDFDEQDLELFWQALINMFDFDHSAARGKMATRKLFVFKHDSELGNAPSHKLFDLIDVKRKDDVECGRAFTDYAVNVDTDNIPDGVELLEKL